MPVAKTDNRVSFLTVTFTRIGPELPPRTRRDTPTLPPLTVHIPPHTAGRLDALSPSHIDAMIAVLTLPVREYVRMSPLVPAEFTVTISLRMDDEHGLIGAVLVNAGEHGTATIAPTDAA